MKTIAIIISMMILGITAVNGQNFIGMSQSKIIKKFGQPDEKGSNYFIYYDQTEGGVNTYYFDNNKNCNTFVLTRSANYFEDYQKLLNKDFTMTPDNFYVCTSDSKNFKAEITKSTGEFQIRITSFEASALPNEKNIVNN
jgi:hypothetical protein